MHSMSENVFVKDLRAKIIRYAKILNARQIFQQTYSE
jgi:hypothetical protein